MLWICLVDDFFTDSTMVNHHVSPPFGEYVSFRECR